MAADQADGHMKEAEKALKPSWMSLKFNPDYTVASMEYANAAGKYRAAGKLDKSAEAWARSAETKIQALDQFGAGRAYEGAGQVCDQASAAQIPERVEKTIEYWTKAVKCFRLAGKSEIAAKLLLKLADVHDKAGSVAKAVEAYDSAIEVYEEDEKEYNLGDVYKAKIGFCVRNEDYKAALSAIDAHALMLTKQKHFSFAHKELLAKVVLNCKLKDNAGVDQALSSNLGGKAVDVEGWHLSKESEMGHALCEAFKAGDAEKVGEVVKDQVFTYLQVEVARVAKQLPKYVPSPSEAQEAELDLT